MKTVWKYPDVNQSQVSNIINRYNVHPVVANLLSTRGLTDDKLLHQFFYGEFKDISSPFVIKNMTGAATLVADAVKNNKKIVVFGDYDVDGTTATVIMLHLLKAMDANVDFFIPNRLSDGYGLSVESASHVIETYSPELVITVDCGITSFDAISHFRENGVNIVVTDHHLPVGGKLPDASFLINPKLDVGSTNEFLCGAAVAFKLGWGVAQIISNSNKVLPHLRQAIVEIIPLVALATVADVMPLIGENRLIVTRGLKMLADTDKLSPGLKALLQVLQLDKGVIHSSDIGFKIAPRINAAGRIADAKMVVDLLCAESDRTAHELVKELDDLNSYRRQLCEEVEREVDEQIAKEENLSTQPVIIAYGPNWHKGVIGVVAARATERYNRSVIIFTNDYEDVLCGSGRAVNGLDLKAILDDCSDMLVRYGGHKGAAGMGVKLENLAAFKKRFYEIAEKKSSDEEVTKVVKIDAEVEHNHLDMELAESIEGLEPFGEGNRKPMLLAKGLSVVNARTVGHDGRHLKIRFATEFGTIVDSVGFSLGERIEEVNNCHTLDVVFFPSVNEWRGRRTIDLQIEDFKPGHENW